jgi:hypothetical protein
MQPKNRSTAPPDFNALYNKVLNLIGGPVEVDTPQLGRCAFPRPAELYQALNYLSIAAAQAAGMATAGVITIEYDRGLWPIQRCI